jgi:hypothetical protein
LRKLLRYVPLFAVLVLVASGAALAQEQEGVPPEETTPEETAPFESAEPDVTFSYTVEDEGATLIWSFDPEIDCSEDSEAEGCDSATIEPNEEGEYNHGSYVSFVAENLEADGPGRGCLIAAVARSGAGMPEDSGMAADSGTVDSPCPAGLVTWLQTVGGDGDAETAEDSDDGGPPDFVKNRGGGPPDFVSERGGGPSSGAGRP